MKLVIALLFTLFSAGLYSQTFDMRIIYKGNGLLGVQLRSTSGTPPKKTDYITDMVFGLKWNQTANADLGAITTAFNLKKAGPRIARGLFNFQAFYADPVGFLFPDTWALNDWVEVLQVAVQQSGPESGKFQICEVGFDATTNPNFGVNFIDFAPLIIGGPVDAALPIKLTGFDANAKSDAIQLVWTTENEINNKGFEVQRMQDEAAGFSKIGWVDGNGTTSQPMHYNFIDTKVVPGLKYQYRLKQLDLHSRESYSIIKWAKLEDAGNALFSISPNPASETLQVQSRTATVSGLVTWRVFSATGAKLLEMNATVSAGSSFTIPVNQLAQGQYFLIATQADKRLFQTGFQKL